MAGDVGAVEGWLFRARGVVGFVKGCLHPLPRLFVVLRLVEGRKTWSPLPQHVPGAPGLRVEESRCLGGRRALVLEPRAVGVQLVAPWDAARRLRGCGSRTCRAAMDLLEHLSSAIGNAGVAGVTGGLAYAPSKAGDVDLVVYGGRAVERAYRALVDMREEGVTSPMPPRGHEWSRYDVELARHLNRSRVLLGVYRGVEYNVRLVPCTAPSRCTPARILGEARIVGDVCGSAGFTTPAFYTLCSKDRPVIHVATWRLRYTEIPVGARVEAWGSLEEWCGGLRVLVPDHGGGMRLVRLRPG